MRQAGSADYLGVHIADRILRVLKDPATAVDLSKRLDTEYPATLLALYGLEGRGFVERSARRGRNGFEWSLTTAGRLKALSQPRALEATPARSLTRTALDAIQRFATGP